MSNNHSLSVLGFLVLIGAVILLLVPHRLFTTFAAVFLPVIAAAAILIALLTAAVIFFAFRKPKATGSGTAAEETNKVLARGRSNLLELRQLTMRLKNRQIRALSEEICAISDKIIRAVRNDPKDIPRTRQFFNYYLPATGEILRKYRLLEESGVSESDTAENMASCLEIIKAAAEKQHANLFDDDKLDLTVEIEVLKQMCRRDGLLTDDDFKIESDEQGVTLGR